MSSIKIVTDSTVDLTKEEIEEWGINVIPLSISINNETFLDRVEITPKTFLEKMKHSKELPKSSQPPIGKFVEMYDHLGSDGSQILSIHMTGNMSGTVRTAESAAEMSKSSVTVVDSRFITRGLAFQVLEAAKMAKDGKNMESILERLKTIRESTHLYVVVDTLENLVKGGRIGKGKALLGSLLHIKPIASLEGGEYSPVAKVRSYSQVVKFLSKQFVNDIAGKTIKAAAIMHADNMELAQALKSKIMEVTGYEGVYIDDTTPIISTHTGPGAIGFIYYAE
ncbi:DegV family protein [Falsibacillus pallidus]|uniref:DegV family protein with EDD domain n=1 Tax=Falsibacillus pallidus TaxID=493781 RepID=A0A370GIN8_9BACI|nr:DegV family protein [Falsibacillus pallidus]RDI43076.1 DegV family protein with EDD domain [Falsibacillus pallidus]